MTKPDSRFSDIATEEQYMKDKQREEFESYINSTMGDDALDIDEEGEYTDIETSVCYSVWQAAQAEMQPRIDRLKGSCEHWYRQFQQKCLAKNDAAKALTLPPSEALAEYRKQVLMEAISLCKRINTDFDYYKSLRGEESITKAENELRRMAEEKP